MIRMRNAWFYAVLIVALNCDQSPPVTPADLSETGPGRLAVLFDSPNPSEGAIVFELRGPRVDSVLAGNTAYWLYVEPIDSTTQRLVVTGDLSDGVLVLFDVRDVSAMRQYRASVVEVSDRAFALRDALEEYALSIAPLK
jgi:hypothetical protein